MNCSRVFWLIVFTLLPSGGLAQNSRDVQEGLLLVGVGSLPIIISAPHGGREPIPGATERSGAAGVSQFQSRRDDRTAEIAQSVVGILESKLGGAPFSVIARFHRKYLDANRREQHAYESPAAKTYYDQYHGALRSAVSKVKNRWGYGLLLDIHGQGFSERTIFRGTHNGRSVTGLLRRFGVEAAEGKTSLFGLLQGMGYQVQPAIGSDLRETRYLGGYTTQTYGSHRGTEVDAIQIELGSHLRSREQWQKTAEDLAEGIARFGRMYLPFDGDRTNAANSPGR